MCQIWILPGFPVANSTRGLSRGRFVNSSNPIPIYTRQRGCCVGDEWDRGAHFEGSAWSPELTSQRGVGGELNYCRVSTFLLRVLSGSSQYHYRAMVENEFHNGIQIQS